MTDSRDKGKRGEYLVRDILIEKTGLNWERVPGSGAFGASHGLKGDIYLPISSGKMSKFTIEVKWYQDEQLTSNIMKATSSTLDKWLDQTYREAREMNARPMLVFKKDRGNWLVAIDSEDAEAINPNIATHITYLKNSRAVRIYDFKEFLDAITTEDLLK
ncbi:hypothetical protein [Vibrio phage JSF12]|uniref:D14 protein n=3 Tax=Jesfedecavirus TaxID=2560156 RepID=A0A2D0Z6B4_9CAUD|nr:RusA-like Holliday junction resolvase [Vibrio phage phi 3]YP_009618482.1 RusA-like Holliday junction resolvase [Vibrio phage JSF10]YP_009794809.1 RusA-like Holliday junction resolvase [Vibrio phage JSF12]AJF40887.1 D14 protein [Vibrio phage phi 3]ASV43455.1 hypothetical protein [Vibrio phage JSF10]ASV43644.1 hypothetical protein [Vibrio phage JSF12]